MEGEGATRSTFVVVSTGLYILFSHHDVEKGSCRFGFGLLAFSPWMKRFLCSVFFFKTVNLLDGGVRCNHKHFFVVSTGLYLLYPHH